MPAGIKKNGKVQPAGTPEGSEFINMYQPPIDFDRAAFTAMIKGKGYNVLWEKSAECPNLNRGIAPTEHAINCRICNNLGFVYFDPIETRMIITNVKMTESFFAYGRWDNGSIMVTALPEEKLSYWDRVTVRDGVNRYCETLGRSHDASSDTDATRYVPTEFIYVAWVKNNTLEVGIQDIDYVRTEGAAYITWISTHRPEPNTLYVAVYNHRPQYIILDLLHQHRESPKDETRISYPVQAIGKLEYMIRREGKDAPKLKDQPFSE